MWEAPSRERRAGEPPAGDALGGVPDDSRPANPWPRLIAFGAVVLLMLVLAGACLVSYARPPERELRLGISELSPGVPRFLPVTTFGADGRGRTFGAWVTLTAEGRPLAVLSRGPESGCHVQWNGGTGGATQAAGAFLDPCGPHRYAPDGAALEGSAPRDLHAFPVRMEGRTVVVSVMTVTLGACRAEGAAGCSRPGAPEVRGVPAQGLPADRR